VEEWAVRQGSTREAGPRRNGNAMRNWRGAEQSREALARSEEKAPERSEEKRESARRGNLRRVLHLPRAAPWEVTLKHDLGGIQPTQPNLVDYCDDFTS
jgi:hypothetical protein